MKYDLSAIMSRAWTIFRKGGIVFAEALHRAWQSAKARPQNATAIAAAKATAGISEDCKTWADWKATGYEVIHGSKALFRAVLIWASHGDGATYWQVFSAQAKCSRLKHNKRINTAALSGLTGLRGI